MLDKEKEQEKASTLVAYHNDFHKVILPKLSVQEQNILMGILCNLRDMQDGLITFYPKDLRKFCHRVNTNEDLWGVVRDLKKNFFKTDFSVLVKTEKYDIDVTINLFRIFKIYTLADTDKLEKIEIQVDKEFLYILNGLVENFTTFELSQFLELNSRYSKTLYRILKQYKNTGRCCIYKYKWKEFVTLLNIPDNMQHNKINERILNPAVKELSTIFKNLRYEKIKAEGSRGRGGTVVGIEFYFDPDCKKIIENK